MQFMAKFGACYAGMVYIEIQQKRQKSIRSCWIYQKQQKDKNSHKTHSIENQFISMNFFKRVQENLEQFHGLGMLYYWIYVVLQFFPNFPVRVMSILEFCNSLNTFWRESQTLFNEFINIVQNSGHKMMKLCFVLSLLLSTRDFTCNRIMPQ